MKITHDYLKVISLSILYILVWAIPLPAQVPTAAKNPVAAASQDKQAATKKESLFQKLAKKIAAGSKKAHLPKADSLGKKNTKYQMQVYGWHPSSLGDTHLDYNYNLLTTLSYYSCDMVMNPQRSIDYVLNGWDEPGTVQMVRQARADGCRIDLTVKCQSAQVLDSILNGAEQRLNCINMLTHIISVEQKADGLTLAFESIPPGNEIQLTRFVTELHDTLAARGKTVSLAIPAEDRTNTYQVKALAPYVHQFILMGYNYYDSKSAQAGPVAPLESGFKWNPYDIKRSVNKYLSEGLPKKQLILALPYYGAVWQVDSTEKSGVKYRFKQHIHYNKVAEHAGKRPQAQQYDSVSHTNYYSYEENGKKYVCFYDNARSLARKYDWAGEQGLAGIGIWALGFDDGHKELWQSLDKKINVIKMDSSLTKPVALSDSTAAKPAAGEASGTGYGGGSGGSGGQAGGGAGGTAEGAAAEPAPPTLLSKMKTVAENPKVLTAIIATLAVFSLAGIAFSVAFESVREKLMITELSTYILAQCILLLVFVSLFAVARFLKKDHEAEGYVQIDEFIAWLVWLTVLGLVVIQLLSYQLFLGHLRRGRLP